MTKYTGVGTVISVGHNSPEGVPHGHSYEVVAWFPRFSDARKLLTELEVVTRPMCHTFLSDDLRFGEDIAEHIGKQIAGCVAVDVSRPLERIYARWER